MFVVISGIELAEKIKKGQYKTGKLGGCTAPIPAIWQTALAAHGITAHGLVQNHYDDNTRHCFYRELRWRGYGV